MLLRSQMKGEELSETGVAYRFLVGPLNDVEVGATIALDELRPVREQSDVPPDKNSVRKYSMSVLDQGEGVPQSGSLRPKIGAPVSGWVSHHPVVARTPWSVARPRAPLWRSTLAAIPPAWKLSTTVLRPRAIRSTAFVASLSPRSLRQVMIRTVASAPLLRSAIRG